MDVIPILANTQNPVDTVRAQAERQLQELENRNLAEYVKLLASVLMAEEVDGTVRQAAGICLKNVLSAKMGQQTVLIRQKWLSLDAQVKNEVKQKLLMTMASANKIASHTAGQVVSSIALVELGDQGWPELIPGLVANLQQQNINLKISSLETIGYICEDIDPHVLGHQSDLILTAVIQGMKDPLVSVRYAATKSLNNAIIFIKRNFETQNERDFIMTTICETCVAKGDQEHSRLRLAGFECLVRVADLYYEHLSTYIEALATLSFSAIKSDEEEVARMAVEFWCTICDEEIELLAEAEMEGTSERTCLNVIGSVYTHLCGLLLEKMLLVEDNDDEDNLASSAGTCLTLVANALKDRVVDLVLPFVENHIAREAWESKATAIKAFGMVLEGPSDQKLNPAIQVALPVIVQALNHPVSKVQTNAAWTISRICEFHGPVLGSVLANLVEALLGALKKEPTVANNACWALFFLAKEFGESIEDEKRASNPLSPFFLHMVKALFECTQRQDLDESNLRISSYEVVAAVIQAGAEDTVSLAAQLIPEMLTRLQATFNMQGAARDELQGLLCGVLASIVQKLGNRIDEPTADSLMGTFLQVLVQSAATVHQEALLAIGSVANAISGRFTRYAEAVVPVLLRALSNHAESQVCSVAVGLVSDLGRALHKSLITYIDPIMQVLLTNLQNPELDNSVRPPIMAVFGDIALAVGEKIIDYLQNVVGVLSLAVQWSVDQNDEDSIEFFNEIRRSVLDAFVGILSGLHDDNKQDALLPYLDGIFVFLRSVAQDNAMRDDTDELTRVAVALIGDLCTHLSQHSAKYLRDPDIVGLVHAASGTGDCQEADYALQAIDALSNK
eukprot:c26368_g1_i1.p1 GENE.c26368_g1_i1~~c26368_g1_i1.p1  ORF type:complete len:863 (+),score=211.06 c26368_g1_i1:47-2590(+)